VSLRGFLALPLNVRWADTRPVPNANASQISIGGVWLAMGGAYEPPVITRLTPGTLDILGGLVTINGTAFGPGPCDDPGRPSAVVLRMVVPPANAMPTFDPTARTWLPPSLLVPMDVVCGVVEWTPTGILCRAPPGLDPGVVVRVVVGGQSATAPDQLRYAAPTVQAVVPGDTAVGTPGGALITVRGSGFPLPPWPVAVLLGASPCAVVDASRTTTVSLTCVAPQGLGTVQVAVFTPLQASNITAPVTYAPPSISSVVTPQGRPIAGSFAVEVHGQVRDSCRVLWVVSAPEAPLSSVSTGHAERLT
jgi:hypothetical protein